MFKKHSSFETEIRHSMEKTLNSIQVEDKYNFNKIAKAADFLNIAASIFEQAGMYTEANEIVNVLQKLAKDLK